MNNNVVLEKNQIRGILQYLERCMELMQEKPSGTYLDSDVDTLDGLVNMCNDLLV